MRDEGEQRERGRAWSRRCLMLMLVTAPLRVLAGEPIMGVPERDAVVAALDALNLTTNDPGFTKDVAEPRWALARVRSLLGDPLALPALGDEAVKVADAGCDAETAAASRWLELPAPTALPPFTGEPVALGHDLDERLTSALDAFVRSAGDGAEALTARAFAEVSQADRVYAATALLGGVLLIDDHPAWRPAFHAAGMPDAVITDMLAADAALNPDPATTRYLQAVTTVRLEDLLLAMLRLHAAATNLAAACTAVVWPEHVVRLETAYGRIVVGTMAADVFDDAAWLILDPGGDDVYCGAAGSANGLLGRAVSVVIDLAGDDHYAGDGLLGPGAALFGVALLQDFAGADVHRAAFTGAGAGLLGVARVEDFAGDDQYRAQALGQGAGVVGVGILRDRAGRDRYDLGYCGQAYAGVRGVGLLIDGAGHDCYTAGGQLVDWDRNEGRFLSMAQGYANGMRPFAGGGIAALIDGDGNDVYQADVYGQGVGYWYAIGMLIDRRGEDSYHLFQYGQGSGIHLSLGLLADGGGRDAYTGYILCQGNAHDYAVGMLFDRDGDDTYVGDHFVQGTAINNSMGLLLDGAGNDAYFARQTDMAQGVGNDGGDREYGSLALLLDLGGADQYTCGAVNGARFTRPDFGIVDDVGEARDAVTP